MKDKNFKIVPAEKRTPLTLRGVREVIGTFFWYGLFVAAFLLIQYWLSN